mgnify:FL=1
MVYASHTPITLVMNEAFSINKPPYKRNTLKGIFPGRMVVGLDSTWCFSYGFIKCSFQYILNREGYFLFPKLGFRFFLGLG